MHRLLLLGLNHFTAPLAVREKVAIAPARAAAALAAVRQALPAGGEAVVLSTCNRVELYLAADQRPDAAAVLRRLAAFVDAPADAFARCVYEKAGIDAVEHLFNVTSSLDSMVLGETQILGQVRAGYELALGAGTTGPVLNPLFQRAVAVGKDVLHNTELGAGRVSVASVAVDYARRIFDGFGDKAVLCVGAGKMARLVLRSFAAAAPGRLVVLSRDEAKAAALAGEHGGTGGGLALLDRQLVEADIVITSTGATQPLVTRRSFEPLLRQRRYRPIFLIDLAVPRDVEAGVAELAGVYVYNLDDLQEVVSRTLAGRGQALDAARAVVARHVRQFLAWHQQRAVGPIIDGLYTRYNEIARGELRRTLDRLGSTADPALAGELEAMTHRMIQKLLHNPVRRLRQAHESPHPGAQPYAHALEKLFDLDAAKGGTDESVAPASDAPTAATRSTATPVCAVASSAAAAPETESDKTSSPDGPLSDAPSPKTRSTGALLAEAPSIEAPPDAELSRPPTAPPPAPVRVPPASPMTEPDSTRPMQTPSPAPSDTDGRR